MNDPVIRRLTADDVNLALELIGMFGFSPGSRHQVVASEHYLREMLRHL